ncbi:MAG: CDP-alcohol phosphatidyltransferase family protein [Gemmatimonadales bacterium]|jgi:CDP-diacylglycerol--glycerol-3-phosphate 3-phosphatidyltransferase
MIWTLPNILTLCRIALTPVIALLPFINGYVPKLIAFVVFLAAAISDIYDGRLARERDEITDLGKLLDPIADKLLLFASLVPIWWITNHRMQEYGIPWWGNFPLWVALILIGRELLMTAFRHMAKKRGVVIAAASAGKIKTIVQDIFIGSMIAWFGWKDMRLAFGWETGWFSDFWEQFHGTVIAVTLAVTVVVTIYSLGVYIYKYRMLFRGVPSTPPGDGS